MDSKPKFRHYLEATLLNALPAALRPLPFNWRIAIGGAIMSGAIRIIPPLRNRILNNLSLIYPEMPKAKRKTLFRSITRHIGRGFIQVFYNQDYHRLLDDVKMAPDAFAEVAAAHAEGRPIILVSGHIGQWEAVRVMLMKQGMTSAAIYKTASNPIFEKRFIEAMAIKESKLFPIGLRGMRPMMQHLRQGGIVSVLLDQRIDDGEILDFLGHPCLTSTSMAALAVKTNALMVPAYGMVTENGQVEVTIEPSIPHGDPIEMLRAVNDSLSAQVQAHPEQWYWLHKRWARPDLQT